VTFGGCVNNKKRPQMISAAVLIFSSLSTEPFDHRIESDAN
jgi:hypothetical protein